MKMEQCRTRFFSFTKHNYFEVYAYSLYSWFVSSLSLSSYIKICLVKLFPCWAIILFLGFEHYFGAPMDTHVLWLFLEKYLVLECLWYITNTYSSSQEDGKLLFSTTVLFYTITNSVWGSHGIHLHGQPLKSEAVQKAVSLLYLDFSYTSLAKLGILSWHYLLSIYLP